MQIIDGTPVYSASDLNDFLACEYLTGLETGVMRGELVRPDERSDQARRLAELGDEHERRYLDRLQAEGVAVTTIARPAAGVDRATALRAAADETLAAMRTGVQAIYQATFFDGRRLGHADVLRRVEVPSGLGAWSYEVEDAKLARSTKPYFLVQLCFYSDFVAELQGMRPEWMHAVLGDGTRASFRVAEYAAYERMLRERFESRLLGTPSLFEPAGRALYPYPVAHCDLCPWRANCEKRWRADDHLSQVAGLTRLQERRLRENGVATLAALGTVTEDARPPKMPAATFLKLARQARLQLEQREARAGGDPNALRFELLPEEEPPASRDGKPAPPPEPRGFGLLPRPSPGDVFFDMEGDPFYDVAHGLEYLFGAHTEDEGYRAFWGCVRTSNEGSDVRAERRAFESFVDWVMERRARDPGMHVYHYAAYEKTALQRLAQRHATREDEVDVLLREERLVDLLRVVRQSIVVGQPGYGLKRIEAFYGGRDKGKVVSGDQSVMEFERWRASADDPGARDGTILDEIEHYNAEDCRSTANLRAWLLTLRERAESEFETPIPYYDGKAPEEIKEPGPDPHQDVLDALSEAIPPDFDPEEPGADSDPMRPLWLARQALDYHRREARPEWWNFHNRCDMFKDDIQRLRDDGEALVGLELVGEPEKVKSSQLYTFTMPLQECKVDGGTAWDAETRKRTGTVESIAFDADGGKLQLKRGRSYDGKPLPSALIVFDQFPYAPLRTALARFATALLEGAPASGRYCAAYDLLVAGNPRFRSLPRSAVVQPERVDSDAIVRLIRDLDASYLFVQGPPGSGKTYQAAHAIVDLIAEGRSVGLTANSHKAVHNVLYEVEQIAAERGVPFRGQKVAAKDATDAQYRSKSTVLGPIENVTQFSPGGGDLYAGTVWAFTREVMDGTLDYLFVDEAGQLALPNVLAAATAARNVVLFGDPQQLPHVRHAQHPGDVGASVLDHLLGEGRRTVDPTRGVLLDRTYRMHADICGFISDLAYEGRLHPVPGCEFQRVDANGLNGTGLRYILCEHDEARVSSPDEANAIADEVERLLQGTVTDCDGRTSAMKPSDIIVVTPYNAQRRCIEQALKARAGAAGDVPVGTVDKFQGQQAYVVFFSTANSTPDDAPRGIDFIFDRNRMNVAISRARALAIYVGSPELVRARPSSVERMSAIAAGCGLVAAGLAGGRTYVR